MNPPEQPESEGAFVYPENEREVKIAQHAIDLATDRLQASYESALSEIEDLKRERDEALAALFRSQQAAANACTDAEKSDLLITETVKAVDEAYAYLRLNPDQDHTRHGIACGQDACILCLTEEVLRSCASKLRGET